MSYNVRATPADDRCRYFLYFLIRSSSSVLIGSSVLHAEGRDCIFVGPDEINGYFGAISSK